MANKLVEVELVIVALLAFRLFVLTLVAAKTCPVKFVTVVEAKVELAVTSRFPVVVSPDVFVVVEFVVEAFDMAKLLVVPHKVVIVASAAFNEVTIAEVILAREANKFVEVELVFVELVEFKFVILLVLALVVEA